MNYIEEIAEEIFERVSPGETLTEPYRSLFRIYAVLVLTTGDCTTNEHVHDAWSAWQSATQPNHRSLVPFDELTPEVQDLDTPYRDAIILTAVCAPR